MEVKPESIKKRLPFRRPDSNKIDFGRVLVVAGSKGMTGAAYMSGFAALKAGCGLIYCAVPENERHIIATMLPEAITIGLPSRNGVVSLSAIETLKKIFRRIKFDVLAIGPGLGSEKTVFNFVFKTIKELSLPCIIDADGLNAIAYYKKEFEFLRNIPHILTPHEGEIKRIIGDKIKNRDEMAKELSFITGGITVLKGNRTIITDGKIIYHNTTGNVGLAKAGSGDILTGLISGIYAQIGKQRGFNLKTALDSAILGVWLHGKAADIAVKYLTNRCLLATEILDYLPMAFKALGK